jgi:hypothetical protein
MPNLSLSLELEKSTNYILKYNGITYNMIKMYGWSLETVCDLALDTGSDSCYNLIYGIVWGHNRFDEEIKSIRKSHI